MKSNILMFFKTAIVGMIAVFVFSAAFAAPQAQAYAVDSVSGAGSTPSLTTTGVSNGSYDFGNSFQNLVSPFTGFVNNLKWNNGTTTINTNGVSFSWPTINVTPVSKNTFQSTLSQWFGEFNTWFYSVTGIQLSGILAALLNLFSWVLGLAQQAVNWLLGLFH
jgi:hypothetical protein